MWHRSLDNMLFRVSGIIGWFHDWYTPILWGALKGGTQQKKELGVYGGKQKEQ